MLKKSWLLTEAIPDLLWYDSRAIYVLWKLQDWPEKGQGCDSSNC